MVPPGEQGDLERHIRADRLDEPGPGRVVQVVVVVQRIHGGDHRGIGRLAPAWIVRRSRPQGTELGIVELGLRAERRRDLGDGYRLSETGRDLLRRLEPLDEWATRWHPNE